jgi:enoyl-CoA hydratase/3-hydroxyacyl-CoA dehydrogenase
VLHVAEYLRDSYGDRFYVHAGMQRLVAEGKLGAKTGGDGFYANGEPQIEGDADADGKELAELYTLKALVEACLVLEEGVAETRAIDLGMMAGAGMDPRRGILPPLMRCDIEGLDTVLERMERAFNDVGDRFEPPAILRRLVAQGNLGQKSGQGFFSWPRPDEAAEPPVQLETRDGYAIAWLNNPPANSLSPDVIRALADVWQKVDRDDSIRSLIIASGNPLLFCAGADIKAFTKMDETGGKELIDLGHGLLRAFEQSSTTVIAAVNAIAYGGGCELAMACDVRVAAESAMFAQPEVNLGIIPGFGGTQRLPRLVGEQKALEMNLTGDALLADAAYEYGLVNQVVPDHELIGTAVAWAKKLGQQAPLAVQRIKQVSAAADLDQGIEAEKDGFAAVFGTEDAKEGISAFLGKRTPRWSGK